MQLVSSAENSTLDWRSQYGYLEDIGDGRGYTGGIIGFCSGTGDMLKVVERYSKLHTPNSLEAFLPALRAVNGTPSHDGLGAPFEDAWRASAKDSGFRMAQDAERDLDYFDPAVHLAQQDGLSTLGQFIYYDAAVVHGPDGDGGLRDIRATALKTSAPPAQGGDETRYLTEFLSARDQQMSKEDAHKDLSRIDGIQREFLRQRNLALDVPLRWTVYGDTYEIPRWP